MKNLLQHILIPPFCHFGGNQREILGRKNQRRVSIFWWAFPWDCLLRSSIQEMFFIYWVLITMVSEHNKALSPLIHLRFWEFLDFGELHGADTKEPIVLGSGVGGMYLPFPKQRKRAGKVTIVICTKKNPAAPPARPHRRGRGDGGSRRCLSLWGGGLGASYLQPKPRWHPGEPQRAFPPAPGKSRALLELLPSWWKEPNFWFSRNHSQR